MQGGVRLLDEAEMAPGLDLTDAVELADVVEDPDEVAGGGGVDREQGVVATQGAGHEGDRGEPGELLGDRAVGGAVETEADPGRRTPLLTRVADDGADPDDVAVEQPDHPPARAGGGEADARGEVDVGGAAVGLQRAQQGVVGLVERAGGGCGPDRGGHVADDLGVEQGLGGLLFEPFVAQTTFII